MSRNTRPLSQVEVEKALLDEVDRLEALTNGGHDPETGEELTGYDDACRAAAEAEVDWKVGFAEGMILQAGRASKERRDLQEARVTQTKKDLLRAYKITEAVRNSHKEALTSSRARIDALRTIAANVRAQT